MSTIRASATQSVPAPEVTLHRLFLTLFLRGTGARKLGKQGVPKSISKKLAPTLIIYALFGGMALLFIGQPVFVLAVYLQAMTFVFLSMFVAASAGAILFNKEEADILLHRPVSPRAMLWAKVRVLAEVSFGLACAFNLIGLFVGFGSHGNWRFPLAHLVSTGMEAMFCAGCVVLVYQLCLRWFGRERLEGLMTSAQVLFSIGTVLCGRLLPQMINYIHPANSVSESAWWIALLPPAWFAGVDDAFAGSAAAASWLLTLLAVGVTASVLWIAFGKLARDYETGVKALNEVAPTPAKTRESGRWLNRIVDSPPLRWWLRDPVVRASFLLTAAYLIRDRDVKLRVYPGLAPILLLPFWALLGNHPSTGTGSHDVGFWVPFVGLYLGMVPWTAMGFLQYSQQWRAAEVFRLAPMSGPALLCRGARRAVFCFTLPLLVLVGAIAWVLRGDVTQLLLFLPGIIALPVFTLLANVGGRGVPLSLPADGVSGAGRGPKIIVVMASTAALAGLSSWAWSRGWFWFVVAGEAVVATVLYVAMRVRLAQVRWPAAA